MSIYRDQHATLTDLLNMASNQEGATLLIPDLQRPYIWKPTAVVVLVDSLIRGWPFGTLLTWKVRADDPARALARAFWSVVDRTDNSPGEAISKKNPPAMFQMVLDGQQRVQSLLLAFGGDAWGFRMLDRDWTAELRGSKPRGRLGRPSWSLGTLCVDLDALSREYAGAKRIVAVDFTKVLRWAVTDSATGQSRTARTTGDGSLPISDQHKSLVRLSRLWISAPDQAGTEQEEAELAAREFLTNEGLPDYLKDEWARPVGSLLLALGRVKQTRVTYLELVEYSSAQGTRESYNDSIVNIFTRLNTAGRTLTREDISFAWMKVGWNHDRTEGRSATQCFDDLQEELNRFQLSLSVEDLVAAVTFMWAVEFNGGRLLSNNDLLKGDTIRPMAEHISAHWDLVVESISRVSELLMRRQLRFGHHYQSQSSIAVLWAWTFCAARWRYSKNLSELDRDAFDKSVDEALDTFADRWLVCSQWAGRWAAGSSDAVGGYATRLANCGSRLSETKRHANAAAQLLQHLESEVRGLEQDAIANGLAAMRATDRKQVRTYYTALWIWNRLDQRRWQQAKLVLREGRKKDSKIEVDHVVAYELWKQRAQDNDIATADGAHSDELQQAVNELGNCLLVEKSFNISKSKQPLSEFLSKVHEFKTHQRSALDWAMALGLDEAQLEAKGSAATLQELFVKRTALIRSELEEFVRGSRRRVDLDEDASAS